MEKRFARHACATGKMTPLWSNGNSPGDKSVCCASVWSVKSDTLNSMTGQQLPWEKKIYRDPHGRGMRQPLFGARIPRYRTKEGRFDGAVVAQLKRLHAAWPQLVESVQCAVEDVPPSDPLPWEEKTVTRSRAFPAEHGQVARIVIYRRPVESIAQDDFDLQLLIRDEIVLRLAELTGRHPDDIDPNWGK